MANAIESRSIGISPKMNEGLRPKRRKHIPSLSKMEKEQNDRYLSNHEEMSMVNLI